MLQSPRSRSQRHRRLASASENPILEPRHDPLKRVQRLPPTPRQTSQSATHGGIAGRRHQHRRTQSVPDRLISIATDPVPSSHADYNLYSNAYGNGGNNLMNMGGDRREQSKPSNTDTAIFPQQLQSRPPQDSMQNKVHAIAPYPDYMHENHDQSASMIDELLAFNPSSFENNMAVRRASAAELTLPSSFEGLEDATSRSHSFKDSSSALPRNSGSQQQSVSAFDLAPFQHPNFINLASLSMPSEKDIESYLSPESSMASPSFTSERSSPDLRHSGLFGAAMPTVPEESFPHNNELMIKVPPLPENTTFDIRARRSTNRERKEIELDANPTGISIEEISSFISGPESSDGKWVCLYPECEKRFGRKENIKSHVQTHLGDRQYRCEVCKKCFVRQHDLKRHAKIHTGIKPYPCLCGNSFARHDALTRHRQRGMCIGAFEGIVKKVAKRGRPRKKPLEDGEAPPKPKKKSKRAKGAQQKSSGSDSGCSSSSSSSSGSDVSDPRSPSSPGPETPHSEGYHLSSSGVRSEKDESPGLLPQSMDSPDDTPPTSPPEFYEFDNFTTDADGLREKRHPYASSSLADDDFIPTDIDYSDLGLPLPGSDNGKRSRSSSDNFSLASAGGDDFLFSQEGMDMFGLTALERDPSILGLGGEDIYVKPELLNNP